MRKPSARRSTVDGLFRLLKITGKPAWSSPLLISLGLTSSFTETFGISLVVFLIYNLLGQSELFVGGNGLLGHIFKEITDRLGNSWKLSVFIGLLIIVRGFLGYLYVVISSRISDSISTKARNLVHRHYLTSPYCFVQRQEQGRLLEVLGTETWVVAAVYNTITRLVINTCSILVFSSILVLLSWRVSLIASVGLTLISLGLRTLSNPAKEMGDRARRIHQKLGEQMLMTIQGMRTIRSYGMESHYHDRFLAESQASFRCSYDVVRLTALIGPATEVGYLIILCIIVGCTPFLREPFSVLFAAVALLYRLQPHVKEFESNLLYLSQTQPQITSLLNMLDSGQEMYRQQGSLRLTRLGKSICFKQVSLRYEDGKELALRNASFEIPVGCITAIVGASGAGKSSIVNILLRLYNPVSGEVTIDGIPLDRIDTRDWASLVAISGQDIDLIEGTVAENIAMGKKDASLSEIVAIAREVGVSDFVECLADGYETWVGQEGMRFSGGQRQRLSLARALLRDAQLLILDEATNALDREAELEIREKIESLTYGKTIVIITHRLETIMGVDHVIILQDGTVVAAGTPRQVLSSTGVSAWKVAGGTQ